MVKFTDVAPFVKIEYSYEVSDVLYKSKSEFQEIMVFENPYFGKILTLDGIVQITERDEFFYHEMLVHVAMHAHPNPKRVVVIGGGDGGTVREVLKHKSVQKVHFIEIDKEVIDVSRKFFPSVACSVDDPRVEIRNMDGAEFIKSLNNEVDIVLVDSTDPIGFARTLYAKEFYTAIKSALTDNGFYVTHSESLLLHSDIVAEVQQSLRDVFPIVDLYTAPIATYPGNLWSFAVGSKELSARKSSRPVDFEGRYYAEDVHAGAFLPDSIYKKLLSGKLNW